MAISLHIGWPHLHVSSFLIEVTTHQAVLLSALLSVSKKLLCCTAQAISRGTSAALADLFRVCLGLLQEVNHTLCSFRPCTFVLCAARQAALLCCCSCDAERDGTLSWCCAVHCVLMTNAPLLIQQALCRPRQRGCVCACLYTCVEAKHTHGHPELLACWSHRPALASSVITVGSRH